MSTEVQRTMDEQQPDITKIISEIILGDTIRMQDLRDEVAIAAPTDYMVLITGETGVGKDVVAGAIHKASPRKDGPFITANCSVFKNNDLLQSELFGYEKGSHSMAMDNHPGLFEQADGGTLFLNEIGDMPIDVQPKFLVILDNNDEEYNHQEFRRLGGKKLVKVNVRIITATNLDLEAAIDAGTFREDLFRRIEQIPIKVPPLREHSKDIPIYVRAFLRQSSKRSRKTIDDVTDEALKYLQKVNWRRNIGELKNVVTHAVNKATTHELQLKDFPQDLKVAPPETTADTSEIDSTPTPVDASEIKKSLDLLGENILKLAAASGVDYPSASSADREPPDETQTDWHVHFDRMRDRLVTAYKEDQALDIQHVKKDFYTDIEKRNRKIDEAKIPSKAKAESFQRVLKAYLKILKKEPNDTDPWRAILDSKNAHNAQHSFNTLVALLARQVTINQVRSNTPYYKTHEGVIHPFQTRGALDGVYKGTLKPMLEAFIKAENVVEKALDKEASAKNNDKIKKIQDRFTDIVIIQLNVLCQLSKALAVENRRRSMEEAIKDHGAQDSLT